MDMTNTDLTQLLLEPDLNYVVDGIDHREFDREWAEQGGWVLMFTPLPYKIILGKCVGDLMIEYRYKTKLNDPTWEIDGLGLRVNQAIMPEYMRMALAEECEQAKVKYEPKHSRDVMLQLADAQITGYIHADTGRSLSSLASDMARTEQEWRLLMVQKESGAQLLRADQKRELDEYFEEERQKVAIKSRFSQGNA